MPPQAERAPRLAKADLVTEMVGEFPELTGTMGKYYARSDGETEEIAEAIEQHYQPRFAGDNLPNGKVALPLRWPTNWKPWSAFWGIGLIPTGDKDPTPCAALPGYFADADAVWLGRERALIQTTFDSFPKGLLNEKRRLKPSTSCRRALPCCCKTTIRKTSSPPYSSNSRAVWTLTLKLQAVAAFKQLPSKPPRSPAANKRIAKPD